MVSSIFWISARCAEDWGAVLSRSIRTRSSWRPSAVRFWPTESCRNCDAILRSNSCAFKALRTVWRNSRSAEPQGVISRAVPAAYTTFVSRRMGNSAMNQVEVPRRSRRRTTSPFQTRSRRSFQAGAAAAPNTAARVWPCSSAAGLPRSPAESPYTIWNTWRGSMISDTPDPVRGKLEAARLRRPSMPLTALAREHFLDGSHDVTGHEAIFFEQLFGFAGLGIILKTDKLHRARMQFGDSLGDADPQPAVHQVFLGGDNRARLGGSAPDGLAIERLYRMEVDDARRYAFGFQRFGSADRFGHQQAVGDDRHIGTLHQLHRLADLEFLIAVIDDRRLRTARPNEHRADMGGGGADQGFGRGFVGRCQHHEAGQGTGQAGLFDAHLRRAVLADGNAAMRPDDLHIEARVSDADAKLLESLVHHERGKAGGERDFAGVRHARGLSDHVGLRDAKGEEPVGELFREVVSHRGFRQVGVANHDVFVLLAEFGQGPAEGLTGGRARFQFELGFCRHDYRNSCKASFISSAFGAVPWNLGLFSMKETPLPLMVWATMAVGRPLAACACSSALRMAGKSWPLISIAFQPNARHLSASGAISMMSFTKPSS